MNDYYTIACLNMIFGDGLAPFSILMNKEKLHKIKYSDGKTLEGSLICFLACFIITILY